MFYEHVDTRISSLSNIKLNQEKIPNHGIEPALSKTHCARRGTVQYRTHSATEPSISRSVIAWTVDVNRTSWWRETTKRNFVNLQKKYAFVKQNNLMRIHELPFHFYLFYKLCCFKEAVFHKYWKIPLKNSEIAKWPTFGQHNL